MEPIESTYQTIGCNIRAQRRRQRLSQACLAEKADVSVDTVRKVESGRRSMRLDTYLRLVEALGTTPLELMETEPSGAYAERLIFIIGGRSENELRFVLHVVEQALKAEELYIKEKPAAGGQGCAAFSRNAGKESRKGNNNWQKQRGVLNE